MFPMGAFGQCLLACSFTAIVLTFVQFASALLFKMVRRSNSSTPEELSKVLKMYMPNGIGDKYLQANPEDVAIAYEQIIVEMLMLSARPTQSWITSAVLKTYQTVGSSEAKSFGQQLAQTCQYCFRKKLQVTTGKKVSGAMRRILSVISSAKRPQSPGDMLRHNAALKRKATNENMGPSPLKRKGLQRAGELYSNMLTPKKASNSTAQLYASMLGEGVSSPKVSALGSDAIVLSSDDDDQVPNASSSSKVAPVPLPTTTSTSDKVAHWYDPAHKALVRHGKSAGELEIAHMAPGAGGFCTATFGGGEPLATEIPNVLLKQPEVPKKCAAKAKQSLKRPAAVKPAIPAEPEACPTPLEEQPASWSYFILFSMFGVLSLPCLGYSLGQTALDSENSMFICELFWTPGSSTQVQQDVLQEQWQMCYQESIWPRDPNVSIWWSHT